MKRLFKSRRTLSASSSSSSVAAGASRHTKAAKSEPGLSSPLGGAALATHARASANRLIELVGSLDRAEIWHHAELQALYRRCRTYETALETEIMREYAALHRMHALGLLRDADDQRVPSSAVSDQHNVLEDHRTTIPLLHSAYEECADRLTSMDDPAIVRISADIELARDRVDNLQRELGQPNSNARNLHKLCLRSRETLRSRQFLLQDAIGQQRVLKTVIMPEIFGDGLITAEEQMLEQIQVVLATLDGALAHWMRRQAEAPLLSLDMPTPVPALIASPNSTFSNESPASMLSSLPLTPGGVGGHSRSDSRGASPFVFTPITSHGPPTPASQLNRFKFPIPKAQLPPSQLQHLRLFLTVDPYLSPISTEEGDLHSSTRTPNAPTTPNTFPLCRRGALRRRQLSLPSLRESAGFVSINAPPPTLAPSERRDSDSSSELRTRSSILSYRSSSLSDLADSLKQQRDSRSTFRNTTFSADLLQVDPGPVSAPMSQRTSSVVSGTHAGSEPAIALTEVYDAYYDESPSNSTFSRAITSPVPASATTPLSASWVPPADGEWLPAISLENHPLVSLDEFFLGEPAAAPPPPSTGPDQGKRRSTKRKAVPSLKVDTASATFEQGMISMLAAEMDISKRRRSHTRSPAVGEGTSTSLDEQWGCRDLTDCIHDIAPRPQGFGGLSDVYSASWVSEGRTIKVAIKVVRTHGRKKEKTLRRLHREIRVWQQLDHPHVLPMYGVHFGMGDFPSLVAPWCQNGDICTYLASREDEPNLFEEKLELLEQTIDGLNYLHNCNPEIVHGDLKGANILVSEAGDARLCDFGFASMKVDKGGSLFQSSAAKGTWRWMAPELLSDDNPRHTKASDIWAYGCLLVEVLSGKVPYHEKVNDVPVIIAIARGEHPSRPADTDDNIWDLMLSCWALDANERPPAEFIIQRLDHIRSQMD